MMLFQSYVTGFVYIGYKEQAKGGWHIYGQNGYLGEALVMNDLVKIGVFYDPTQDDIAESRYYIDTNL